MAPQGVAPDDGTGSGRVGRFSAVQLLLALFLLIVAMPLVGILPYDELIQAVLLTFVLLFAVIVVAESRKMLLVAVILATPAFVGKWLNEVRPDVVPAEVFLTAAMVFVAFVVLNLFRFILKTQHVDLQALSAAAANYLMIGLFWMFAYALLAQLLPGSFAVATGDSSDGSMDGFNALYFSFVTLSTVGYGDITPVSRPARMLSILEATTGIFYVTILIARLVAVYSSEGVAKGKRDA